MKKLAAFVLIVPLCVLSMAAYGQGKVITGTVTSATDNQPLPGATVMVVGTTVGTVTDIDGKYVLSVPQNNDLVEVSFIGYKSMQLSIGTNTVLNAVLQEDVLQLSDVVVTAIGIKSEKRALGYSVQDVDGDDLVRGGSTNTIEALSGKVAGLQITQSSGSPGSSVNIRMRGATSLKGNNQPLFVIDGVPIDNSQTNAGNPDNLDNNLLESVNLSNRAVDINPNDIESITVLKGPAATALYGINASNGAVIITTKKGSAKAGGGVNVTYSTSLFFDKVSNLPAMQDQFVKGSGGAASSYESTASGSWGPNVDSVYWDPEQETAFNQYGQMVVTNNPDTFGHALLPFEAYDNLSQFFRTGQTWENNLSLSGGTDRSTYLFSISALNQEGVVPLSTFDRYTARLSAQTALGPKWMTSASIAYTKSGGQRVQQGSNLSGLMLDLLRTPISFDNSNGADDPTDPSAYIFDDGTQRNYRGGIGYDNPYWTINQNPYVDDVNRVYGYAQVDYNAYTWLKFTYRIGSDVYSDRRKQDYAVNSRAFPDGLIFQQDIFYRHINSDLLATATKKFSDKLEGSLTLGNNLYDRYLQDLYVQGDNLNFGEFFNFSVASDVLTRESVKRYRTAAFYGMGQLSWDETIFLNITGRQEMSSTLPVDNNSFFYPSVSLGWVFTESFGLSNNKIFPYGKLRVSYASVGKDATEYALENYYEQAFFNDGWTTGIAFPLPNIILTNVYNIVAFTNDNTLGNPFLKPEHTNSIEFGVDLRFLSNRLGLDATYYTSKSEDQILPVPIPGSTGYQFQIQNTGSIENKGIELTLNAAIVKTENFTWDMLVNWSTNKSEVLSLGEGINELFLGGFEGSAIYAVVGEEYGSIYGTQWLKDDAGNLIIEDDPNSDNYGYPIQDAQVGVIGNVNPDWIAGITNSITWKGVNLSFLFDFRQGGDIWNGTRGAIIFFGMAEETENRGETTIFDGVQGHYDVDGNVVVTGAENTVEVPLDQTWYQGLGSGFGGPTEQFVEDASYVKLRELSLGYSFPKKMMDKTPFASLDISFIGRNLLLFTEYTGVDPETSLTGANNSGGMDYFNMPNTKTYGVSLRVTL